MKKAILTASAAVVALAVSAGYAAARDQVKVVGSSTVFPYSQAAAEEFANKTGKDVELARTINKLVAIVEKLQGRGAAEPGSVLLQPDFAELAKYKVFENIIAISNRDPEPVSSSADFSRASIDRRIAAGYRDAAVALASPPKSAAALKAEVPKPA